MNIFIYWNYRDNDSKKIYKFLDQSIFLNLLNKDNNVIFCKEHNNFNVNIFYDHIRNSEVLIFFTHGEDDSILKFRYKAERMKKDFTFIDFENADLLKGKKVIAVCCRSANQLGEYCVSEDIQGRFYVGFRDDLIYDEEFPKDFKAIVYKTYSCAFEKAFINAYKKRWPAERFVLFLKKYINDMLTSEILSSQDRKLGSVANVSFHRKTAEALVVLGQSQQLIFE